MISWKEAVIHALEQLGGQAHLREIYAAVARLGERSLCASWQKYVRHVLDTGADSFYSVHGTKARKGWWALVDYAPDAAAKKRFLEQHGHFFCEACGFRFDETYGEEYIEVHDAGGGDFLMLCANCHAMLRRKGLTRETLEQLFYVQLRL